MRTRPRSVSSRSRSPPRGVSRGGDRGRHSLAPPSVRSAGRGGRAALGAASGARVSVPLTYRGSNRRAGLRRSAVFAAPGRGERGRGWAPLQRRTRSHPRLGPVQAGPGTVRARYRPGPAATARRSPSRPTPVLPHLGRGARPRKTKVTLRLTLRTQH